MYDDIESCNKQTAFCIRNSCDKGAGSNHAGAGGRIPRLSFTQALSTSIETLSHHLILHRLSMLTSLRKEAFLAAGNTRHMRTVSSPTDI